MGLFTRLTAKLPFVARAPMRPADCTGCRPRKSACRLRAPYKLPTVLHSGHSGIGSGVRGGGGLLLKYSEPIHLDEVAADFPDMKVVIAQPSWPRQDQALSICLCWICAPASLRSILNQG
jgi:hypothetical protein